MDDTSDPTADFLAREQAILGDTFNADFNAVQSPAVNNVDAFSTQPLADALPAAVSSPAVQASDFGAFEDSVSAANSPAVATSAFSPMAQPLAFNNTGGSTGSGNTGFSQREDEPEAIKEWRVKFQARIAEIDAKTASKKDETLKKAKEDLERFYAEYEEKKKKSISRNRDQERLGKEDAGRTGNTWDRVLRQIETTSVPSNINTNSKPAPGNNNGPVPVVPNKLLGKDTSRLRNLMVTLKNDAEAPCNAA